MNGETERLKPLDWGHCLRYVLMAVLLFGLIAGAPVSLTCDNNTAYADETYELIDNRTATSKIFYLGDNTYHIHASVTPIHYQDEYGDWQDIDVLYSEADTGDFTAMFTRIPYIVRMGDDSGRRIYPDRNDLSYWIHLYKPYPSMGTPEKSGGYWYWDFTNALIAVKVTNGGVKFAFRLKNDTAPNSITIPFTTQGITRDGNLLYHDGEVVAELQKPYAVDANGTYRDCEVEFGNGTVTVTLDTDGLVYPIDIDPTVNVAITASVNDGSCRNGWYSSNDNALYVGNIGGNAYHTWALFEGITIPQGATVNSANFSVDEASSQGNPLTVICADDQNNPTYPTSYADYIARTATSANVDWDGNPPANVRVYYSITTVIQELVTSYDYSSENICILWKDDGGAAGNYRTSHSYDFDVHTDGPELDIEYTTGGTPDISDSPESYAFGTVNNSANYSTGLDHFTIINNSAFAVDIAISTTNYTGGVGWTVSETATPGENTVGMIAGLDGGSYNVIIKTIEPYNQLIDALAASDNQSWGFRLLTPTSVTDGAEKTANITLTATAD